MTLITLKDVLYCQDLACTLISLVRCDKAGFIVLLRDQHCTIRDQKGTTVGRILRKEGLYKVEHKPPTESANAVQKIPSIDELHRQMGHISPRAIKNLLVKGIITGIEVDKQSVPTFCTSCAKGKMTRKPILKERIGPRATRLGDKVHSDVWGPTTPQSYNGKEYFISFTDDFTRWSRVTPMKRKSEVLTCYKHYEVWAKTQHGAKIKRLQSDRGGEYLSKDFNQHLKSKGTVRS
jgi:Integrase core domain/GAG-pre-integrase domain